tara:strand:+ start:2372 stop:4159 length:1788 start_codon:yes stop_codon:yes gene_type:complete
MTNKKYIIVTVLTMLISVLNGYSQNLKKGMEQMWGETNVSGDALISGKAKLFDEGNYGMFIHWGLFSNLGGVWEDKTYYGIGEWLMSKRVANIAPEKYMETAKTFNPTQFDAKQIAQLAKDAGMKYIIITSKHHEGFAMFDTEVSDFNIVDATPFGRDPMHELSAACKELGLGFGFYYSHNQDWTAPGGTRGPKVDAEGNKVDFKDYFYTKCKPQVREICTNYGQIDFVWFDTPGDMPKKYVVELADMVRELQPNAMMCSRVGYGMGDYASIGDMEVPTRNVEGLWETCDTNNDSWSYAWYDNNFKSPKKILGRVIETVARGGSYLFNVGPNSTGSIPNIGIEFLQESGRWIQKYPQVIYAAGSSPWGYALPWGDVTTNEKSLFLSVSKWPTDGKLYIPGLKSKVKKISLLDGKESSSLNYSKKNDWLIINVPYQAPEKLISVIEVELKEGDPVVETNLGIYPNNATRLLTEFGEVEGAEQKNIRWMEKFGEWKHANQVSNWKKNATVCWEVNVQQPGYYYLDLEYKGDGRLVWKTTTDENIKVQNQQAATNKYAYRRMGIIEFKTQGNHTIKTTLVEGDVKTSSLKSIMISPIN